MKLKKLRQKELVGREEICSLRSRLQFVIVLALFFPTLLDALYQGVADQLTSSKLILQWGSIVSFLIVSYLIIEFLVREIRIWALRTLDVLLLTEVALFIPVLMFFSRGPTATLAPLYSLLFKILFNGLWLVPIAISLLLASLVLAHSIVSSFCSYSQPGKR